MPSRRTPFVVALTALALAPPAAQAHPAAPDRNSPATSDLKARFAASHGKGTPVRRSPRVEPAGSGFDSGSAAMGAGDGLALVLLGALGVGVVGRRGRVQTVR